MGITAEPFRTVASGSPYRIRRDRSANGDVVISDVSVALAQRP
jgi:hypothetical protein